jgi:multimeric flavodoxin WrbA|tara:strand:+ start:294 stop:1103 length:810 start_codon:yes stop_codon:yes gene_type:complete
MSENKTVLGLVGSPNPDGLTNQLVTAALDGAQQSGASIEKLQMSEFVVDPCQDCLPWTCLQTLECKYNDENFEFLNEKILDCSALILGTPVYWWDTSAMVKYLILKMFRVFAMSGPLNGLPALGLAIAGGSGTGLLSGLKPVYHFFQIMRMRAIDPVPATRFDFQEALAQAAEQGRQIGGMSASRDRFESWEESLLHFDSLRYIRDDNAAEMRLVAELAAGAVDSERKCDIKGDLAHADDLATSGKTLESMTETLQVYQSSAGLFGKRE